MMPSGFLRGGKDFRYAVFTPCRSARLRIPERDVSGKGMSIFSTPMLYTVGTVGDASLSI